MSSVPLPNRPRRRPTATSRFGVSRRESHDASGFYARFAPPEISGDARLAPHAVRNRIWLGDARRMDDVGEINDGSVSLVVTSPPYFAGKEYEEALGEGHIPASYHDYLEMLHGVFSQCKAKLEPGGRLAVNVANLGRKPYRSLSADVIAIVEDLGLLLRGEIIWRKQQAPGGSCAWGTYQRPGNPVLRDITERIVIASKGRFDRALGQRDRLAAGWPAEGSMFMDDFMDATTDLWDIPAESATRVGHPAPFPVDLPRRVIELYTYRGDLVLDPFMGSGSTAVAALRTERFYVGFDTDPAYVERAERRVAEELERLEAEAAAGNRPVRVVVLPKRDPGAPGGDDPVRQGQKAAVIARRMLAGCGFTAIEEDVVFGDLGVDVSFRARDARGRAWLFDLSGALSTTRPGLRRADVLWRSLGKAAVLHEARRRAPQRHDLGALVLLSTDRPPAGSAGARALDTVVGPGGPVTDVAVLLDPAGAARLSGYAAG